MSKYDFMIDLSENSSTGMLLKKIRQGSTVLEFGCATGRMTKYMQEELHCHVYIVEIDREAFDSAIKFAEDGICGDILNLKWKEKFSEIPFDHILFADVLEHLSDPDLAVREAAELLSSEGNIICSIPNITHNDIIFKELENRFDYTKTGLLDNTHIHFWGLENIKEFAEKNGLYIHSLEATYRKTGDTEQYGGEIPRLIGNIFDERSCGTVYQFAVVLGNAPDENGMKKRIPESGITSNLYADKGKDFNESDKTEFLFPRIQWGKYQANLTIDNTEGVRRFRWDPIEGQSCILKGLIVRQGDNILAPSFGENIQLKDGVLLLGNDPMIFVELLPDDGSVHIEAQILLISGDEYIEDIISSYKISCSDNNALKAVNEHLTADNNILRSDIEALRTQEGALKTENERLCSNNRSLKADNNTFRTDNERISKEVADLTRKKNAYIQLADAKEEQLIYCERQNQELQNKFGKFAQREAELNIRINELSDMIERYRSRKAVRLADRIGKIFRKKSL